MATINQFQSTFTNTLDAGHAGKHADSGPYLADNLANNEATASIGFGLAVKADGDDGCKLPALAADKIEGVAMTVPLVTPDASGNRTIAPDGVCVVMQRGRIFVTVEQTVAKGDPVYVRHTANGAGKDPGQFRMDSDGSEGVYPQVSLTLSGQIDDGNPRAQKLVLDADLAAGDNITGTVAGQAISTVTFGTDHQTTMQLLREAIEAAVGAAGLVASGLHVGGATLREIHLTSEEHDPAALALTAWSVANTGAGTAQFVSATGADLLAGALPHTLTVDVSGTTITQEWAGSHDDTVHLFAEELASHAKVTAAAVTHVAAGPDLTIVLTGANYAVGDIDLTNGNPTGGTSARTAVLNNAVTTGVAVSAKAAQWQNARWLKGASAGKNAVLELYGTHI